jgi:glycine oxidase
LISDFVVVGAGIIGLTSARELAGRGARVTVVEKSEAGREASWAGAGILATLPPWEYPAKLNQLAVESAEMYPSLVKELERETGIDAEYLRSGALVLPPYDEERATSWRSVNPGAAVEVPRGEFNLPHADEALLLPSVAQVRTPRLLRALASSVRQRDVQILEHSEAVTLEVSRNRVEAVVTSKERIKAGAVIVCAGAWSQQVLGNLALGFETEPVKGEMLLFNCEPGLLQPIVLQGELYLVPRRDGHVLAGSSTERCGFDKTASAAFRQHVLNWANRVLPQLNAHTLVAQWTGLRPAAETPTIARHPRIENLYVNSGHFRYGVTMAPGSARRLADIACTGQSSGFPWPSVGNPVAHAGFSG